MRKLILYLSLLTFPALAWAQQPLSLPDAVRLALRENKSLAAAGADDRASGQKTAEARSGMLPKVNYSETWARGDNPVFVFGSLLTQHQFAMDNFQIGPLNRPGFLNDFQSQVTVDQPLYDAGMTRNAVKTAQLSQQITGEELRRAQMEVMAGVVRAYYGAMLAEAALRTAEQSVQSAEADLRQAESVHQAGMSTDADVLSIRVHLAAVSEQRIQSAADLDVARAALNDALGLPLDTPHTLTTSLEPIVSPPATLADLEPGAVQQRPEARESRLALAIAQARADSARNAFQPTVGFHGAFEADRQRFLDRGGANWLASVSLRWNLFDGFADKRRVAESAEWIARARADRERTDSAVRLQLRRAHAALDSADQRIEVAKAAAAAAQESLRITRNRYEAGMSNVTDLLRNETALLESRTRYLAAVHDQRIAATMLELAAGRLTPDSEVLK